MSWVLVGLSSLSLLIIMLMFTNLGLESKAVAEKILSTMFMGRESYWWHSSIKYIFNSSRNSTFRGERSSTSSHGVLSNFNFFVTKNIMAPAPLGPDGLDLTFNNFFFHSVLPSWKDAALSISHDYRSWFFRYTFGQCFPNKPDDQSHLGMLVKRQRVRAHPWKFWFSGSGVDLIICIFNKDSRWLSMLAVPKSGI